MTKRAFLSKDKEQKEVVLCIGSNCGMKEANIAKAIERIETMLSEFRHSSFYLTPDYAGGEWEYMNAVCVGKTSMSHDELEEFCKAYELSSGRDASARQKGEVPMDLDIVVYDGYVVREMDFSSEFFKIGYEELSPDFQTEASARN